jgi:hypothetical protein
MSLQQTFAHSNAEPVASLQDFRELATDYARWHRSGLLKKADAVDCVQRHAELWGVVDLYGQDAVQAEMAAAFSGRPAPILPEPASKQPEPDPVAWRSRTYETPQATIDAFWYVTRTYDADYAAKWLANHPKDIATLTKLWKAKKWPSLTKPWLHWNGSAWPATNLAATTAWLFRTRY